MVAPTLSLPIAVALVLAAACSGATEPDSAPSAPLTTLPRALTAGEQRVMGAANDFSFALFRRLGSAQQDDNVFTSPLSASMALGMAMNGAAGTTHDEMRATLGFAATTTVAEIGESYESLIALLRGLDPSVDFRIANSIWYRTGFPVHQSFLDAGRDWFDARVSAIDFGSPDAVPTINDWVSQATAGKIPTILETIREDQIMFLINAIYFKGSWRTKFDPAQTIDAPFHAIGGDQPAKLMHREGTMRYLETADFRAVDLPYGSNAYSMTVVLPNEGRSVQTVAASLQSSSWTEWMTRFRDAEVDLHLPRLKLAWERGLIPDLESLGMRAAFVPGGADFTRLSPAGRDLYISVVKQKTYVDVNEEGTEAAAVTNVGISLVSMPVRVPFRVDRPFILVLRERLSGTILFMGKIVRMP
jgi:serine protease inhibitor